MARISDNILPANMKPYMNLDRYQEIMRLPIKAFNGLNDPEEEPVYECSTIWMQSERDFVAQSLAVAEEMREEELTYPLAPKYFQLDYAYDNPLLLYNKHLIRIGERKYADVSIGAALVLGPEATPTDPVVLNIATALTDATEIKVYYPGEDVEIHPTSVVISGGILTIRIPRSRLVLPSLLDNRENHLSYYENDNFLTTVDVKREYYDVGTGALYVWGSSACGPGMTTANTFTESTQVAYHKILDNRLAKVQTHPATYNATTGVWTVAALSKYSLPDAIRVRYVSGRQVSQITEMLTIRLAHTLMPNKPCSCPTVHQMWQEDILVDENVFMTPYGNRRGAVAAWVMDSRQKIGQGGKFPRVRPKEF